VTPRYAKLHDSAGAVFGWENMELISGGFAWGRHPRIGTFQSHGSVDTNPARVERRTWREGGRGGCQRLEQQLYQHVPPVGLVFSLRQHQPDGITATALQVSAGFDSPAAAVEWRGYP
jgi:hypothetical protein